MYQPRVDLLGGAADEGPPLPEVTRGAVFSSCLKVRPLPQSASSNFRFKSFQTLKPSRRGGTLPEVAGGRIFRSCLMVRSLSLGL